MACMHRNFSVGTLALALTCVLVVPAFAQPQVDEFGDPLPAGAVKRLGTVRLRENGPSVGASLSPDGTTIAVSRGARIQLLDVATGKETPTKKLLQTGNQHIGVLHYSRDGKFLIGSDHQGFRIWNIDTGEVVANKIRQDFHRQTAFSDDGARLASSSERFRQKNHIAVIDTKEGKELAKLPIAGDFGSIFTLSGNGKLLAYFEGEPADGGNRAQPVLKIWDIDAKKDVRAFALPGGIGGFALSHDGARLATSGYGSAITVWNVADGQPIAQFAGGGRRNGAGLEFSPDGKRLASVGYDGNIRVWNIDREEPIRTINLPNVRAAQLRFLPRGGLVAFGFDGHAPVIWDPLTGKTRNPVAGHNALVSSIVFLDKQRLVSAAGNTVLFWDLAAGRWTDRKVFESRDEFNRRTEIGSITISPNGKLALLDSHFEQTELFDLKSGQALFAFDRTGNHAGRPIDFAAGGAVLATAGANGANVWSADSGRLVRAFGVPNFETMDFALSPDGTQLALVSANRAAGGQPKLELCDIKTGKVRELGGAMEGGRLAFLPDGSMLAQTQGTAVVLHDVASGNEIGRIAAKTGFHATMTFSPDGRLLALATAPNGPRPRNVDDQFRQAIHVYEIASRTVRTELAGHAADIHALQFSPDGQTLASGAADTTVLLWDLNPPTKPGAKRDPKAADLVAAWRKLEDRDAARAYAAMRTLADAPAAAIEIIGKNLKPAKIKTADLSQVDDLIAKLGDEKFLVRERASSELAKLGPAIVPALKKALADDLALETKRRIEGLIGQCVAESSTDRLRSLRAIEILERLATPESLALLRSLASGEPDAPLTTEATSALRRSGMAKSQSLPKM